MNNNSNKSFNDLVSKMEQLKESEQGKLKGGFSSVSGNGFSDDLGFDQTTNTCTIKNKNRGTGCAGCSA